MKKFLIWVADGDRTAWTVLEAPDLAFACMDADRWFSGSRWRRIDAMPIT
jgi:hypothetical protein